MNREGQADRVEAPNPNSILTPDQAEDNSLYGVGDANAVQIQQEQAEFDPELADAEIKAPPGPSLDIEGGSPFGTVSSMNPHHEELHALAAQTPSVYDGLKEQLIQTLEKLANQQPFMDVVGQQNPELYQAVHDLVRMVITIARGQGLSKSERKSPTDQMAEAVRVQTGQAHDCKAGDCYYATEALYHLLGGAGSGTVPHAAGNHWYLKTASGKPLDPTTQGDPPAGRPRKMVTPEPSQKAVEIISSVLKQGPLKKADMAVGAPSSQGAAAYQSAKQRRQYLKLPVGTFKQDKVKIQHANGHTGWRQVRAGMVQGLEADAPLLAANSHPVSVKRPFDD